MANNIISTLLGSNPFSLYNMSTKESVTLGIKITKLTAQLSAEPQRQMLEDGTTITDSKTVKPGRITMDVICPDLNALKQINSILSDRQSLYQITTRGLIFAHFMVDTNFLMQNGDVLSATPTRLSFKQILIENLSPVIFANQADSSVIDRGIAVIDNIVDGVGALYDKVSGAVSNAIG